MRPKSFLLLVLSFFTITSNAQQTNSSLLNVGDNAPPLKIKQWLKGTPVHQFEKGKIYVMEFWATWCGPCIAAMPHLSDLAREYKNQVTIIGVDVKEDNNTPIKKVQAFVDKMGKRMNYNVAVADSTYMETAWFEAAGEQGIPKSFVINTDGKLAWIGHPRFLAEVLKKIVSNTWEVNAELAKRNLNRYLEKLDNKANDSLKIYTGDYMNGNYTGKPDSTLLAINYFLQKEPRLKYAPGIVFHTFSALLKTDMHKAYEYGKTAITTTTYDDDPPFDLICDIIDEYSNKLNLTPEIYELGAESYQAGIDAYPEIVKSGVYRHMVDWYWRANNKTKSAEAAKKAIEVLKSENESRVAILEEWLQQYKVE